MKARELKQILDNLEKVDDEGRRSSLLDTLCDVDDVLALPEGWRTAREVIDYLRARGGKIPRLGGVEREEAEWAAALSSDGETNYSGTATADEELEWVPSSA